ncbi:Methenyltetrahydrofolate cyclohydrolase [uncultured Eubacterium sp.]|nr:Methenyltetrahydrofolate cyclohydrolase [uncultured Eubacterium sp.]
MNFTDKSCREFVEVLSSKAPVPGGGGASALVGALGTALGNMVGQLTLGKKKYADVEEDISILMEKASKLQEALLILVEKDAEVFEPLAKAYSMPKETEEEKTEKENVMAQVLRDAAEVPLEIMRKCCQVIELQGEFAAKGSRLAVSDAGVGVIFCKSALQGASLNVFINTKSMKDRELAEKIDREADEMLREYTMKADEIFASVFHELRR